MKIIVSLLLTVLCTTSLLGQIEALQVERFNKRFEVIIPDPVFIPEFPVGLIYQDTTGSAFTNLSDNHLRISDGPIGFQFQLSNLIYSQVTKNSFSINHLNGFLGPVSTGPFQRAYWGPRNFSNPFEYDMNTFGDIYTKNTFDDRLTVLTESNGRGAVRFYRYSGDFVFYNQLSISAAGVPEWTAVSDRRAKDDIVNSEPVLKRLRLMRLKNYTYKGDSQATRGFIAQEVQTAFPDLVSELDDGMLGVNYMGLGPLAIEAINEQQEIIETLEDRISKLEAIIMKM